jgi:hypothetical protein
MRVAVEILGSTREPRRQVQHEQILAMLLRPGTIELGSRHSEMARFSYGTGEMILARRHLKAWVRVGDVRLLARRYRCVDGRGCACRRAGRWSCRAASYGTDVPRGTESHAVTKGHGVGARQDRGRSDT